MVNLDQISPKQIFIFTALAITATILFTNPFSIVTTNTTLNLNGCTLSQSGDTYTVDECFVDNNQNSDNSPVAYDTDDDRFSEFDLIGPNTPYTQWTKAYIVDREGFNTDQFEMECTDSFDFLDDSRDIDFCTNNQELADRYQSLFGGTDVSGNTYSEGNVAEETGYDYVIRTGFPRTVRDALREQSSCTATLTSYEGVTVQADGTIAFVRGEVGGSRIDRMSCVVDLPQEHRGYGQHRVEFTIDADFTEETDTGNGDDGSGGTGDEPEVEPRGVFDQFLDAVRGVFNTVLGVFR